MEYLVGRLLRKSLAEVRELPKFEFYGWCYILTKYGDGVVTVRG